MAPPKQTRSDPTGLFIDASQKYRISTCLGEGACGSVHALVKIKRSKKDSSTSSSSSSTSSSRNSKTIETETELPYAVKLALCPSTSSSAAAKKRKKTLAEKNADLLNHENLLYRNVLNNLRGDMVPDIPVGKSGSIVGFGDIDGFRFLVMERMSAPLSSIIPALFDQGDTTCSSKSSTTMKSIKIGKVAARLVALMKAIHETQHVFVDVKPDNFMIRDDSKRDPSNQICMLDFGLVESYRDVMKNRHRIDNFPDGQIVGTPTYASLNVLDGHTVSRRDDLEAVGYVILELILQLRNYSRNKVIEKNLLPWSCAKSDEEIKILKNKTIQGLDDGVFWNEVAGGEHLRKGGKADLKITNVMKEYMDTVRELDFKEKPDYDNLCHLLSTLIVKENNTNSGKHGTKRKITSEKKVAAKSSSSAAKASSKCKSKPNKGAIQDECPTASPKISTRATRAATRNAAKTPQKEEIDILSEEDDDIEMISVSESNAKNDEDDDDDDGSANDMDWEIVGDENEFVSSNTNHSSAVGNTADRVKKDTMNEKSSKSSLRLDCIEGPHKGETVLLEDSMIIGRDPKNKARSGSAIVFNLCDDGDASLSHAKLVLNRSGRKKKEVLTIKVFDLSSTGGTFINNKVLPKGGSRQAFAKDRIQLGNSVFLVLKN